MPLQDNRIVHIPEWVHSILDRHFPTFALHERVFQYFKRILLDADYLGDRLSQLFVEAEILQTLAHAPFDEIYSGMVPLGRFMQLEHESNEILGKIKSSIETYESDCPYVTSAIFGDSPEQCVQHLDDLAERLPEIRSQARVNWFWRR